MTNWQPSERASTDEEVLQMVTKATKISNPERTRTKIPGAGTLPRAGADARIRKRKTRPGLDPAARTDEEKQAAQPGALIKSKSQKDRTWPEQMTKSGRRKQKTK
jgi:hypothetical protein